MDDQKTLDAPRAQSTSRMPWLAIALLIAALIAFFGMSGSDDYRVFMNSVGRDAIPPMAAQMPEATGAVGVGGGMAVTQGSISVSAAPTPPMADLSMKYESGNAVSMMRAPDYYPYSYGEATAKDTREFNKIYYNADMQTRNVQGLTRRVETTVRGHGGRVDNTSSSQKYGSVSFVVPQDKFEDFRSELESMVGSRYLSVNVNSQNLLPQKQGIEQQQASTETSIADLAAAKKKLLAGHTRMLNDLQSIIDDTEREIAERKADTSTDVATKNLITARLLTLANDLTNLKAQVANENSSYAYKRDSLDSQIKYANSNLTQVKAADQNLLDNVATVSGTVSIRWISVWEIVRIYLPGNTIPGILLVLAGVAYWWHRRKFMPRAI